MRRDKDVAMAFHVEYSENKIVYKENCWLKNLEVFEQYKMYYGEFSDRIEER